MVKGAPLLSYLVEVVLSIITVASAGLHQPAGGLPVGVPGGHHPDTTVALLHHDGEQDSSVDAE